MDSKLLTELPVIMKLEMLGFIFIQTEFNPTGLNSFLMVVYRYPFEIYFSA